VMKPKPFASLNHFTVPLAILMLLIGGDISPHIQDVSRCGHFWVTRVQFDLTCALLPTARFVDLILLSKDSTLDHIA
jgi:hypothetical protein